MIILLSPAKTLDFEPASVSEHSTPRLLTESERLVKALRKKSARSLKKLMSVSDNIAKLNVERYQNFETPFTPENAKQAALAFKGDVYAGFEAETFDEEDLQFAQKHIRILSGLYGVLRPLDLMQPYRLEMGTPLKINRRKNLYEFWDEKITELINDDLKQMEDHTIINLASNEYFRSVKPGNLTGRLIHIHFKERRNGQYKVISFNAKKARGRMASLIVKNRITHPESIKKLSVNEYIFNKSLSDNKNWIFSK